MPDSPTVFSRYVFAIFSLFLGLLWAGSALAGIDHPIERKLTWFQFLNGNELRSYCHDGVPDRFRMIYNAVYTEQVRVYDATLDTTGMRLHALVFEDANLAHWTVEKPGDIWAPWRGKSGSTYLPPVKAVAFLKALERDGVFNGAPEGLWLDSERYYWVVAACRQGRFSFYAAQWPKGGFATLTFPELVFQEDPTGIAVKPPKEINHMLRSIQNPPETGVRFRLEVGQNGLVGIATD
ncbi:MAG: hypothetical protein ACPGO3_12235 [Magnetospiraceae bacterium]